METDHVSKWGNQLERSSWSLIFFGKLFELMEAPSAVAMALHVMCAYHNFGMQFFC